MRGAETDRPREPRVGTRCPESPGRTSVQISAATDTLSRMDTPLRKSLNLLRRQVALNITAPGQPQTQPWLRLQGRGGDGTEQEGRGRRAMPGGAGASWGDLHHDLSNWDHPGGGGGGAGDGGHCWGGGGSQSFKMH